MINQIDPVQGLVDYTKEVKPYHTKITEVLVDYIHADLVGISVVDNMSFKLLIDANYNPNYCVGAGFGTGPWGDYYTVGQTPIQFSIISIDTNTNHFTFGGDFRPFVEIGNSVSIRNSTVHINGEWTVNAIAFDPITHITNMAVTHVMGGATDGIIVSTSLNTYPITHVDVPNKLLVIDGNFSVDFTIGDIINVDASSTNDGNWLVTSVFYHLLEDTTVLGVDFDSIPDLVAPANGNIIVYPQSNFDLPETCADILPNMARTTFIEEIDFVLGDTVWFRDFISVEIIEPTGIVPWSGGVYGWGVAGYNSEWPSFITMVENMSDFLGMSVQENMSVDDGLLIPNMGQYEFNDIGWDASAWDDDLGAEWDAEFAPDVALHAVKTAIVDSLSITGNIAGGFDLPYFDVGVFD